MRQLIQTAGLVGLLWTTLATPSFSLTMAERYRNVDHYRAYYESGCQWGYVEPAWVEGADAMIYPAWSQGKKTFIYVDCKTGRKKPAFDHEHLAGELSRLTNKRINPYALPFNRVTGTSTALSFQVDKKTYFYNSVDKKLSETAPISRDQDKRQFRSKDRPQSPRRSAHAQHEAYIKDNNLFIKNLKTGQETQLSTDGTAENPYVMPAVWSPDFQKLVCCRRTVTQTRQIPLIESSPKDQTQPKWKLINYIKPGDPLPIAQPVLFDLKSGTQHRAINVPDLDKQYFLGHIKWANDSRSFTFDYNKRGHSSYIVYKTDTRDAQARPLITETFSTFVNYTQLYRYDLDRRNEILWISERDGWRHLYLIDYKTGNIIRQVTSGSWVVKRVLHVDEKNREVLLIGCGRTEGEDPYLEKLYRVNLDTGRLVCLTPENANHQIQFSPDFHWFVDTASRVDLPASTYLRSTATGAVITPLETSNIEPALTRGWKKPIVFSGKGRDGKTDIWGMIALPPDFKRGQKYPVIEYIYAGPHDSHVPKTFNIQHEMMRMTELGFITVMIDGMGTSNRSKKFHDVCWKNLKDAGFPDRIAWMKQAAKLYPEMDLTRVGIYGTSAGGQNTMSALLFHPEWYKVGVASCGCHDNRMDKIWWNEQWMGYPIGKQYEESSNVVNASKLQGELMLILGELDDNVDPASTIQVVNALIKADKNFEFVLVPGAKHTAGERFGELKRRDFFVKHLLGVDPPNRNAPHSPKNKVQQ